MGEVQKQASDNDRVLRQDLDNVETVQQCPRAKKMKTARKGEGLQLSLTLAPAGHTTTTGGCILCAARQEEKESKKGRQTYIHKHTPCCKGENTSHRHA